MLPTVDDGMTDAVVIQKLRTILGARLTAYIAGANETRIVRGWADGTTAPPAAVAARLRVAYRVAVEVSRVEGNATAQAWFMGLNPNLADRSPAQLLRDGGRHAHDEVIGAVRQFLAESGAFEPTLQRDSGGRSDRAGVGGWLSVEEASLYYASIGPWVTAAAVMECCGVSEQTLERWRDEEVVLGVEFADGEFYYPAKQFVDGNPLPGLARILQALKPAFKDPASQAGWLAAKAYQDEPTTRWDVVREGQVELVRGWADEDAAHILRP